jgi:DNA-directed RNA polymerase alpha subunit
MNYTLLTCVDSRVENATKFYGRFEIGPFAPGQGLTVANALRRSLLSQVSGTSITLLKIEGASHEYEMLSGIRESILDIILNLKEVVLTSDFEIFSPQIGFLNVKGPGKVCARDLKLPSFVHSVDPNQYIATLTADGCLNMKFLICCGKNYITYNPGDFQYLEWLALLEKTKFMPKEIFNLNFALNKSQASFPYKNINFFHQAPIFSTKESVRFTPFFFPFLSYPSLTQHEKESMLKKEQKNSLQFLMVKKRKTFSLFLPLFLYKKYFLNSKNFFKTSFVGETNQEVTSVNPKLDLTTKVLTLSLYEYWKNERSFLNKIINNQQNLFHFSALQNRIKSPFNLYKAKTEDSRKTSKKRFSQFYTYINPKTSLINTNEQDFIKQNTKKENSDDIQQDQNDPSNSLKLSVEELDKNNINFKTGYFPIDAVFMPVNRVNYLIEATDTSDIAKDLVVLEVWTNGSIHPRHAIHKATKSLLELFLPLQQMKRRIPRKKAQNKLSRLLIQKKQKLKRGTQLKKDQIINPFQTSSFDPRILALDIGNLKLSAQLYSLLKQENINTVADLFSKFKKELLVMKGFGPTFIKEMETALMKIGLQN